MSKNAPNPQKRSMNRRHLQHHRMLVSTLDAAFSQDTYILISFVTCMIGFCDLYKNVPLLKATASHICGPLFNWIEESDMISRIRYLGTMLFLQNFERAIKWFLKTGRVLKLLFLVLTKPLMEPLQDLMEFASPVWLLLHNGGSDVYDALSSTPLCCPISASDLTIPASVLIFNKYRYAAPVYNILCGSCLIVPLLSTISSPRGSYLSLSSYTVAFFRPLFYSLWKHCQVPLGVCSAMGNHAASFCTGIYQVLEGLLMIILNIVTEIGHLAIRLFDAKPTTNEVSVWNSLWKDLFSKFNGPWQCHSVENNHLLQLFRALRSVLCGLIAFLDSFNQHRLSTSNQLRKYSRGMSRLLSSGVEESPPALLPAESCQKYSSIMSRPICPFGGDRVVRCFISTWKAKVRFSLGCKSV
ncbi:hypothetical protein Cgig2_028792 [Carnegiea gigantea]|uniref:Uncharacterized protein n=1 Tax=Carnegiea gigantea TaxID=171969 RepID=A0A9Q1GTY5_9CARY|nr:hypothetical protein Cgig2_028792 [Carnegiea gigantea]